MWTSTGFERLIRRWEEDAAVGLEDINGISKDGTTLLHAACGTGRLKGIFATAAGREEGGNMVCA